MVFYRSGQTGEERQDYGVCPCENMDRKEREYMIYLSLYDGVTSLEIGIDKSSFIDKPQVDSPRRGCPIVMYGTSILQGGCVSRPGMAHTS